ncbi:MAG: hypothetical protein IJB70_03285 [Clostridia bacterium]|nr:hypothetical protein [Clostridia bacterium]
MMKVGLLPFYITLYSDALRVRLQPFCDKIAEMIEERGIKVVSNEFCMEAPDFEKAIAKFEEEGCDAIVTLHTAYSPSLESADALKNTHLPIIICDTTETFDFSDNQEQGEISYCHGIHGVMDMCNLLKKNGKPYAIAAGHYTESDVIDRVVGFVKAAVSAQSVNGSKVGSIGGYFDGMGDFRLDNVRMKSLFGVDTISPEPGEIAELASSVTDDEINAEKEKNKNDFNFIEDVNEEMYRLSIITDLAVKKWIEKRNLQAFSINFRELGELDTMPFNAICRAMSNQIGYAGEGDTLTAVFTGALMQAYKETSFVEIFCPDWKNDTLFISHMGEINYLVADKKPEAFEYTFKYGKGINPIVGTAAYKPGEAMFINIYEDPDGFNALIAPVNVVQEKTDSFCKKIRGWLDFDMPISDVLEKISMHGATHHSILVYGAKKPEMEFFAKLLGINPVNL